MSADTKQALEAANRALDAHRARRTIVDYARYEAAISSGPTREDMARVREALDRGTL